LNPAPEVGCPLSDGTRRKHHISEQDFVQQLPTYWCFPLLGMSSNKHLTLMWYLSILNGYSLYDLSYYYIIILVVLPPLPQACAIVRLSKKCIYNEADYFFCFYLFKFGKYVKQPQCIDDLCRIEANKITVVLESCSSRQKKNVWCIVSFRTDVEKVERHQTARHTYAHTCTPRGHDLFSTSPPHWSEANR